MTLNNCAENTISRGLYCFIMYQVYHSTTKCVLILFKQLKKSKVIIRERI
ncbi:hypothetical protein SAMN02745123_02993 [Desulforamulus aeronauticus DSM 10349]|uniref:Uncharacterized protein n=1 Tax=Desulforamulus aeronauticus DSM 10349 TaxID=1121421 RepID=A0A1M6UVM6_9FIRM|nr:hypothetical protein SAMN02745123_02933 [Desulforamulus aeronauticus DSM 10349]SHK74426.1 hypothetical protein SAMN02745123_02993 [Desulforamulus aeronauticus DSM 10349]